MENENKKTIYEEIEDELVEERLEEMDEEEIKNLENF